jgi:hypothetical protein
MRARFIAAALAVTFAASMASAEEPMTDEQKTLRHRVKLSRPDGDRVD